MFKPICVCPAKAVFLVFLLFSNFVFCGSTRITFLGDTHFGESYQFDPKYNDGGNVIRENGYEYFFEHVKNLLLASDYTVINLETPLVKPLIPTTFSGKPYLHWSNPELSVLYFSKYNIDAVSLGNNHTMDYSTGGLNSTVNILSKNNIEFFGGGINTKEALKPLIKIINGFRFAVFGGFEYRKSYDSLYNFYAKDTSGGVNMLDVETISSQIKELKAADPGIFVIIFPHWGGNYKPVKDRQKVTAHRLIEAGADLIIGHGAHTLQEIEEYKSKIILYSIGNFIFNAPGRFSSTGTKPYGLACQLLINDSDISMKLFPFLTDNKETGYQITPLEDDMLDDCHKFLNSGLSTGRVLKKENHFTIYMENRKVY